MRCQAPEASGSLGASRARNCCIAAGSTSNAPTTAITTTTEPPTAIERTSGIGMNTSDIRLAATAAAE